MTRFVAVEVDGDVGIHVRAHTGSGYMTLCGLDGGLTSSDQREVALPPKAKIDCAACMEAVKHARRIRTRDFIPELAEKLK